MQVHRVYRSSPAALLSYDNQHFFLPQNQPVSKGLQDKPAFEQSHGHKRRALIVDDVPDVTEMLAVLLTHEGYRAVTANSAADALAFAREQQFDIVISDIGMPEMNGYQLAKVLRDMPGYESIPMIAVTGYSMFNDREKSLASGFTAHMTKPIDPRALIDLIDQL